MSTKSDSARATLAAAVGALVFVALVGCANTESAPATKAAQPSDTPPSASSSAQGQGTATMRVDSREFTFTLDTCSVSSDDVLVAGPGAESGGGTEAWLDVDLTSGGTAGEARVDLGTAEKFSSSDEFYTIGDSLGGSVSLAETNGGYRVTGSAWNEHGTQLGSGELDFTCS